MQDELRQDIGRLYRNIAGKNDERLDMNIVLCVRLEEKQLTVVLNCTIKLIHVGDPPAMYVIPQVI